MTQKELLLILISTILLLTQMPAKIFLLPFKNWKKENMQDFVPGYFESE